MNIRAAVAGIALAFLLTSCGEDEPQPAGTIEEWRAAVEARIGHPVEDWDAYQEVVEDACEDYGESGEWGVYIAVGVDNGFSASGIEEDVSYACPEHLDDVRAAIEEVQDGAADVEEACAIDPDLRTEKQQLLAEAMGC